LTIERHYPPHILRERLFAASVRHDGQALTQDQFDLVRRLLDAACGPDRDQRVVLQWLFSAERPTGMTDSHILAALDWLKPTRDAAEKYRPSEVATVETRLVLRAAIDEANDSQQQWVRTG
jgi:hypothetical protein